jgi:hypothetical protein
MALLGIELPIGSNRLARDICRKVDKIRRARVPNLEESLLPLPARFQAGEPIIRAPLAGREYARPALHYGFRKRKVGVLDRIDLEVVEAGECFNCRPEADKSFHKRDKGGKVENGVAGAMVGLKPVEIKKALEGQNRAQNGR